MLSPNEQSGERVSASRQGNRRGPATPDSLSAIRFAATRLTVQVGLHNGLRGSPAMTDQNDPKDTEGHKKLRASDDDTEGHAHTRGVIPRASDDDTEGHSFTRGPGVAQKASDDDTEGHSFTRGPGVAQKASDDDTEG